MKNAKDIFLVHTKSIPIHLHLYDSLHTKMDEVGISVWDYGDWEWQKSYIERDSNFDNEAIELMSDIDKEVYGITPPRRVPGDVDRKTLHNLITRTPTVLIFELSPEEITSGIEEEDWIIDKKFKLLFPLGHFALIRFGVEGYFTRRYPMHCGAILDIGKDTEITSQTIDKVALFALQMLIRKDMVSRLWIGQQASKALDSLSDWVTKSEKLFGCCDFMTIFEHKKIIVQLVESVLLWIVCLTQKFGAEVVWKQAPSLFDWVKSGIDQVCQFSDLSEEGLINLVNILSIAGPSGTDVLAKILYEPFYRGSHNTKFVSYKALMRASREVAFSKNQASTDPLISAITSGDVSNYMRSLFLKGLGRLAEDSDRAVRRDTAAFMKDLINSGCLDISTLGQCLSAFGHTAEPSDASWLYSFTSTDWPETVQLNTLLSLMRIIGAEACDTLMDFVERANQKSLRAIGSASWRINQDRLYDALLAVGPDDKKMAGIVIYSLGKIGNPRVFTEAVACLSSLSSYIRGMAVTAIPQIINRFTLSDSQIQQLVGCTAKLIEDQSELIRFGALKALLRCSQQKYVAKANVMLRHLLSTGSVKLARIMLLDGGLGIPDWPDITDLRFMLFHPSHIVRGIAAFLVGVQGRSDLEKDLKILQNDPIEVPPIISENASKDIGNTVAQCADLALKRLSGNTSMPNLREW